MPIEESTAAKLTSREIRDVYSRLAPFYGFWEKWVEQKSHRLALDLADVRAGEIVLEIAVGAGSTLQHLARKNRSGVTVGLDITWGMLQRTSRLLKRCGPQNALLCGADARLLPFPNCSFDLVFSAYMLDLMPVADIEKVVAEIRRVLKPSGRVVLLYVGLDQRWFNIVWGMLYSMIPNLLGGCRPIHLTSYLAEAGFTILKTSSITQLGIPAEVVVARPGN